MKKDDLLKGNSGEAATGKSHEFIKSIKEGAVFKNTYAKDASLLKAMLQNRFNKESLNELSDYQLEELGKYLKKLDSYQTLSKEI